LGQFSQGLFELSCFRGDIELAILEFSLFAPWLIRLFLAGREKIIASALRLVQRSSSWRLARTRG